MLSPRGVPIGVGVIAVLLTAAACIPEVGGSSDLVLPTPDPAARIGGTITLTTPPLDGIDPGDVHEPAGALVVSTFCDTLVSFDPRTAAPRPALAESWTVTRGGRTLFLRLRPGVRFHDGSELTADDVVFTLTRVASQEYASRSAHLLSPIAGYGFVHGDAETDNPRARRELAGVSAADRRTVEIELTEPRADFLRVLGHPATAPVSRAAVEADPDGFAAQPVCAGPYRLARPWARGEPVRLERSDGYHAGNAAFTGGGAGYAERIVFVERGTRAAQTRAFRSGRADVAGAPLQAAGATIERAPGGRVTFIGLPTSTEPFDDPIVRSMMSTALNRTALVRAVYGRAREPAVGFLPPGVERRARACLQTIPDGGNVEGARAFLERAGIELSGVRAGLSYNPGFGNAGLAREAARQWRRAFGLRLTPRAVPFGRLLDQGRTTRGLDEPFTFGWEAAYPGVEAFLVPLFDDSGIGIDNLSRYDSATFADALDAARRATDDVERAGAYSFLTEVLCAETPMIAVSVDVRAFHVAPRIGSAVGGFLDAAAGDPIVRELYVRSSSS